jgi:uncharacterized protein
VQWNVSELLKSPTGTERVYGVDDEERRYEEIATRVTGTVRLMKTDKSILATAEVDTGVRCSCSRCLTRFTQPLRLRFSEEYFPTIDLATGARLHDPIPEGAFTLDKQHTLDLGEAVRQYALMKTPMKPLCTEACRGLCPTCGANRNETACSCRASTEDFRWAGLDALRGKLG